MYRTLSFFKVVNSLCRNGNNLSLISRTPRALSTAAAADELHPNPPATEQARDVKPVAEGSDVAPTERTRELRPLQFNTLQFLLQRRMPISSMRLLTAGVRLACDERRADEMIPYLGAWMTQLTRPENLDRLNPWTITDILRDLIRLTRTVGVATVRNAVPAKQLQILANRLIIQGFDKITPLQLSRAAEGFTTLKPWISRAAFNSYEMEIGEVDAPAAPSSVWPSSDWVDELVDWLNNLKPDTENWQKSSSQILATIVLSLARSNYKPHQPTLQAAAGGLKTKFEEQLNAGYSSRKALSSAGTVWNIWRINPEEYAPGYWDAYFKSAAHNLETYMDSVPDPPSIEDDVNAARADSVNEEKEGYGRRRTQFNHPSLLTKRREFRNLLVTIAMVTKHFDLTKKFDDELKSIWALRVEEHAPHMSLTNARRILSTFDVLGERVKPQVREKLTNVVDQRRQQDADRRMEDRDIDDFDSGRSSRGGSTGNQSRFDDNDDLRRDTKERGTGRSRRNTEGFGFNDRAF